MCYMNVVFHRLNVTKIVTPFGFSLTNYYLGRLVFQIPKQMRVFSLTFERANFKPLVCFKTYCEINISTYIKVVKDHSMTDTAYDTLPNV